MAGVFEDKRRLRQRGADSAGALIYHRSLHEFSTNVCYALTR